MYANLCIFWVLFMLYDSTSGRFNLDGWKTPVAVALFPATFSAVVIGALFDGLNELISKI